MSPLNLVGRTGPAHNFINDIENGKKWVSRKTPAKLSSGLKAEVYQFFLPDCNRMDDSMDSFFTVYLDLDDFTGTIRKMAGELRSRCLQGPGRQ
jgi:hypothetical protein